MFLVYSGSSLHGGVLSERNRLQDGILINNFFATYLLATKVPSEGKVVEEEGKIPEEDREEHSTGEPEE